jgi:PBP1b-binding outer membrane lipoprotein LpoB
MADEQKQQFNVNFVDTKPIFADEVALALKIKAMKNEKGAVEKEGQITMIFMDMMKSQAIGEFVINKSTAKALLKALSETVTNLEKQLSDKSMPPPPTIKTTADTSYR